MPQPSGPGPTGLSMGLLDDAIARCNLAAAPVGGELLAQDEASGAAVVDTIRRLAAPAEATDDLLSFVRSWRTGDHSVLFEWLMDADLLGTIRECDRANRYPHALMPVFMNYKGSVWVELATADHPGGRVFRGWYDEGGGRLIAHDLAEIIDLHSDVIEAGGLTVAPDGFVDFESAELEDRIAVRLEGLPVVPGRDFSAYDRPSWPEHWLALEGESAATWALRGATHTVAQLDEARETGTLNATVVATFRETSGGGGYGSFGFISDDGARLSVYVPLEIAARLGHIHHRLCELDVIAMPSNGNAADSALPIAHESLRHVYPHDADGLAEVMRRMADEMARIDKSVVIVGARPIEPRNPAF